MGLFFKISVESQLSDRELDYFFMATIYYQASKKLCKNLESKVINKEDELGIIEVENKNRQKKEAIEYEKIRYIEKQLKHDEDELRKKQNEEKKRVEEKLVYKTIMEIYAYKKREKFNKEHSVMPVEVISKIKNEIPDFSNRSFMDARRILQKKGVLNKVAEDKLLISIIIK